MSRSGSRLPAHPLTPLVLAPIALGSALAGQPILTWAALGGLAGFTLSGSV